MNLVLILNSANESSDHSFQLITEDRVRISNCAVNYGDRNIIVPPEDVLDLKEGMAIFWSAYPVGAAVTKVGDGWFEFQDCRP